MRTATAAILPCQPDLTTCAAARRALLDALDAGGMPWAPEPASHSVSVGDYAITIWPSCAPFAVYGPGDWLPRQEFNSAVDVLAFLRGHIMRAA